MKSSCLGSWRGLLFDPVCSLVAVARSAKVDWTSLCSLDIWYPYRWEHGDEFEIPDGYTTVSTERFLDDDAPLSRRSLPARAACFAHDQLL